MIFLRLKNVDVSKVYSRVSHDVAANVANMNGGKYWCGTPQKAQDEQRYYGLAHLFCTFLPIATAAGDAEFIRDHRMA
jgi:hypothetical protein